MSMYSRITTSMIVKETLSILTMIKRMESRINPMIQKTRKKRSIMKRMKKKPKRPPPLKRLTPKGRAPQPPKPPPPKEPLYSQVIIFIYKKKNNLSKYLP